MSNQTVFHEYQKAVGIVIRKYRETTGFSQEVFASQIGMHRTYFGAIERGERNLTLRNLVRISSALMVPLSTVINDAEKLLLDIEKMANND